MRVNLYATFREHAGVKHFILDQPSGISVGEAIRRIVECYPVLHDHWLNDRGELHAHVHVFVNGSEVFTLPDALETRLQAEDTLDFFPPVAGG